MKCHRRLVLWLLLVVCLDVAALDATHGVKVTTLVKTLTSWDGRPIVYPPGTAEMTSLLVELAPGGLTGWHCHLVPSFAYLLEGTLEVTLDDGRVKRLNAGEALSEVANRTHIGRNAGDLPVKLVVFYAGAAGTPLSVAGRTCLQEQR